MQFWLLLFGAVACVALSGGTPEVKVTGPEAKETDEEAVVHHDLFERQVRGPPGPPGPVGRPRTPGPPGPPGPVGLPAPRFNADAILENLACGAGISFLEDRLENLDVPTFTRSGVRISSIDIKRVDIGRCDVSSRSGGNIANPRVRISLSDIYLEVTGRYRRKVVFVFKGKWEVKIRNAHLDVDATLGVDLRRRRITSITVNSCSDNFTDASVRFHGSLSAFIINFFRRRLSDELGKRLKNEVCKVSTPFLENELIQRYPNIG